MRMYSRWKVWEWAFNRNVVLSGNTIQTKWATEQELVPPQVLAPGEQERYNREGKYSLVFFGDNRKLSKNIYTEAEFCKFVVGANYQLKIRSIGTVEILKRN